MSISFKPTTYNTNMFTLTPIEYSFKCVVSSLDRVGRKNVLNIVLGDEDLQLVANIEYEIRNIRTFHFVFGGEQNERNMHSNPIQPYPNSFQND